MKMVTVKKMKVILLLILKKYENILHIFPSHEFIYKYDYDALYHG